MVNDIFCIAIFIFTEKSIKIMMKWHLLFKLKVIFIYKFEQSNYEAFLVSGL